ncbi:hypothetical protein A2627_03830 [Candidatus Woesebacteria bacterium RIFCSPHIGHO2_01_FULL_39_28]|uniref:Penicillin-binding protein 2 n=1 Tax=Candidatus Woesebacteria bacterium RIFCSPHIGHO2_01_FULL_39_28 TaxID=1802496 RepID=A0A1F7YFP6_9BACT|nr:MAG: hypothetical protein A2627_03830 [Candidatus Woesebacteria bacterium RIFCSPHIGHO2_01_FULL_39_28]OGM58553.1 MAG: hypothetical protein A3A50_00840 [Candidatus Woesebacteria bacterium RIFCSPLOWO2_01_FULL_38_20]
MRSQSWLIWLLKGVLLLSILTLFARLTELQVIKGRYYRTLAEENRVRRIPIPAPRGIIYARGGEILVGNVGSVRKYEIGSNFAHVSGIIGEVNANEVGKVDPKCPDKGPKRLGSLVGRGGLEEEYDCRLRGIDGEQLLEVDTAEKLIRVLGKKDPISGEDIKTNIDYGLQKKVADLINNKRGAIVVSDGQGQILALYSSPSFDPNLFLGQENSDKINKILSDKTIPLFNRVIAGTYHPGSVFKIVVATSALEEGKINKDFVYDDPGVITVNGFNYSNWYFNQYGGREGAIGLTRAIARSTDTFFYKIGEMVGPDLIASWADKFGLSKKTGIDLPGEVAGFIPTSVWKESFKGERWFLGNTYHMAIGQGDVSLTPLSVNMETSVIASKGFLCEPSIAHEPICKKLEIKDSNIELIKEGMVGACSKGGTAFPFFDFRIGVACKTGTAETNKKEVNHAWFTVFAPIESPIIVVTVLVEEGGEGSSVAAPIAKDIMDYYFSNHKVDD